MSAKTVSKWETGHGLPDISLLEPLAAALGIFVAHHLTFLAAVSDMGVQLARLYPEGAAEARFKRSRVKWIYACCRRHGLYRVRI